MGWRINLVKNDLPLTPEAIASVVALNDPCFQVRDNLFYFNPEHLEWMDYVWNAKILSLIDEHKLNGEILFSSSEGDNRGEGWGYRFEDGVLTNLTRNAKREYVRAGSAEADVEVEAREGVEITNLSEAKPGDFVAIGYIAYGVTSYDRSEIGDILPDGTIVVDGVEFRGPHYRTRGDFGTHVLKTLNDPSVELED